jgi:hypothetical protein
MTGDPLTTARRFAALGLSVIPVPRPVPGISPGNPGDGKVPAIAWKDFQQRRATDDELIEWFGREPYNIAVVTGAISDVVVIDADDPRALAWCTGHLKYTPWQTRTSRGFHLWYRYPSPAVHVGNRARLNTRDGRLAIDVRGDGGYVIAPGSVHASGIVYGFAGDWTIPRERVPIFWPGWIKRPPRPPTSPTPRPRPTGDVIDRARRYLAAIPAPIIGEGSDEATYKAACHLVRGFALTTSDTIELLWEWAGGRSGWDREWVAAKVTNALQHGKESIGGLR